MSRGRSGIVVRLAACLLGGLVGGACGQSHGPKSRAADASAEARDERDPVCSDYALTACARRAECDAVARFADPICEEREQLACEAWGRLPGSSLDAAAIEACTSLLAALDCASFGNRFSDGIRGCIERVGTLPAGRPCLDAHQCAGRCSRSASGCGTCEAGTPAFLPVEREITGSECTPSGWCGGDLMCRDGTCAPRRGELGGPCDDGCPEGAGLVCDRDESMTCKEQPVHGAELSCGGGLDPGVLPAACEPGLVCSGKSDRGVGRCRPWVEDGGQCDDYTFLCTYPARCLRGVCTIPGPSACD